MMGVSEGSKYTPNPKTQAPGSLPKSLGAEFPASLRRASSSSRNFFITSSA